MLVSYRFAGQRRPVGAGQGRSPEHGEEGGRLLQHEAQGAGAAPQFPDVFAAEHLRKGGAVGATGRGRPLPPSSVGPTGVSSMKLPL